MKVRHLNASLLAALAIFPLVTGLQEGVVGHLTIGGVRPDLVMLVVVDWGLIRGVEEGMLWGFVGGIFVDIFSGLPFGTSSAAYVAIAGVISLGENALMRTHVLLPAVAAAIATTVFYVIAIVIVASVRHTFLLNPTTLRIVVGVAIYNLLINPLIYMAAQAFDRRLHPVARTTW